jgi:hypothetical protein
MLCFSSLGSQLSTIAAARLENAKRVRDMYYRLRDEQWRLCTGNSAEPLSEDTKKRLKEIIDAMVVSFHFLDEVGCLVMPIKY